MDSLFEQNISEEGLVRVLVNSAVDSENHEGLPPFLSQVLFFIAVLRQKHVPLEFLGLQLVVARIHSFLRGHEVGVVAVQVFFAPLVPSRLVGGLAGQQLIESVHCVVLVLHVNHLNHVVLFEQANTGPDESLRVLSLWQWSDVLQGFQFKVNAKD